MILKFNMMSSSSIFAFFLMTSSISVSFLFKLNPNKNNNRIVINSSRSIKILYNSLINKENDQNSFIPSKISGLCAVYKPKGISSSGVVGRIKYILQSGAQKIVGNKVKIKVVNIKIT